MCSAPRRAMSESRNTPRLRSRRNTWSCNSRESGPQRCPIASVVESETASRSVLPIRKSVISAEAQTIVVKKADIDDRKATKSAMPEDYAQRFSKQEIEDVIAFLARQTVRPPAPKEEKK